MDGSPHRIFLGCDADAAKQPAYKLLDILVGHPTSFAQSLCLPAVLQTRRKKLVRDLTHQRAHDVEIIADVQSFQILTIRALTRANHFFDVQFAWSRQLKHKLGW